MKHTMIVAAAAVSVATAVPALAGPVITPTGNGGYSAYLDETVGSDIAGIRIFSLPTDGYVSWAFIAKGDFKFRQYYMEVQRTVGMPSFYYGAVTADKTQAYSVGVVSLYPSRDPYLYSSILGIQDGSGSVGSGFTGTFTFTPFATTVPEPSAWAMMIVGFGAVGFAMRRRTKRVATTIAV